MSGMSKSPTILSRVLVMVLLLFTLLLQPRPGFSGSALAQGEFTPTNFETVIPTETSSSSETPVPGSTSTAFIQNQGEIGILAVAPTIVSISPSEGFVGPGPLSLTITGTDFQLDAFAQWNGNPMLTTYIDPAGLTAELPAEALALPGTLQISVVNPVPEAPGLESNTVAFSVTNAIPVLAGLSPNKGVVGDAELTLVLNGTGFVPGSRVFWNSQELVAAFSSWTQLAATVPASLLETEGTASVYITSPAPGGGSSSSLTFSIVPPANIWIAHSPEGGYVDEMVVAPSNPSILYASTLAGIFKSVDAGDHWFPINTGLNLSSRYFALAVDPADPAHVIAGGTWATYMTSNGGTSWTQVHFRGIDSPDTIRFDPNNNDIVYLAAAGYPVGPENPVVQGPAVFRSEDGGLTWADISGIQLPAFVSNSIVQLVVDPHHAGTIYILLRERQLIDAILTDVRTSFWKTVNNGLLWEQVFTDLPPVFLDSFALDPLDINSLTLYAVTGDNADRTQTGLYRSEDGGVNWTLEIAESQKIFVDLFFSLSDPAYIYASTWNGFYISSDSGATWQYHDSVANIMSVDPSDPSTLYGYHLESFGGISKSTDLGATWIPIKTGFFAHWIQSLDYLPSSSTLLASAFGAGYWTSTDLGYSWTPLNVDNQSSLGPPIVDPNNPEHMLAGNFGQLVYETTDGWQTWSSRTFTPSFSIAAFASNSYLFAGTEDWDGTSSARIYKSIDNGATWVEKSNGLPVCSNRCMVRFIVADPVDPNIIYADLSQHVLTGSTYTNYEFLVKTVDGGENWISIHNGIRNTNNELITLSVDPTDRNVLYVGTTSAVMKSVDGGLNWSSTGPLPIATINVIFIHPGNGEIIYLGTGGHGVHRSVDGGATWVAFNNGLSSGYVFDILGLPSSPPPSGAQMQAAAEGTTISRLYSSVNGTVFGYAIENYNPTAVALSTTSVPGKVPLGTRVGSFSTTDPNGADAYIYSLVPGEGGADNASFSISGNDLVTAEVFDQLLKSSYSVRIRSTDSGGLFTENSFTISISPNSKAPILSAPAGGEYLLYNRPLFDWEDVNGAVSYSIQVSRNTSFSNLVVNTGSKVSSYASTTTLPSGVTLYWRVRSNFVGYSSAWSLVRYLLSASPPGVPVLARPANASLTTDDSPRLDWSTVTVPAGKYFDHYELQLARDNLFNSPLSFDTQAGLIGSSEYTFTSALDHNTRYYWRVRSYNTIGHYSTWSSVWSFRTAITQPVLSAPAEGSTALSLRPVFDWPDMDGASYYSLQVSRNSSFSSIVLSASPLTSTFAPAVSLPANVTLYWRVRALGPNGPSLWSSTGSWYSPNPPGIPALLLPASGSLTTNLQPRLDWSNSTLPAGTTFNHYKVELSTNPGFAGAVSFDTPMSLIGSSEYTFTEVLAPNTTYYWRVRALNNVGQYSVWSAVRNFRTALKPPVLVSPVDTFRSMELRPPFDWEDVPGAAGYTIQISRNDLFTSLFLTANPVGSSYIPTINLPKNTTLFWRVRTRGANGPSLWSDAIPRSFSTPLNPPPAPSLLLPALNALDTSYTPTFTWNAVLMPAGTFFERYILQVDNDSDFSSQIISDSTLTSPTFTSLTPFSPNTKYYWRVRVVNSLGEMGNWSAVRYFRSAMPKPELSAPEQDATLTTRRPTFSWPSAAGATSYTFQVSRYANFSTNLISVTVSGLSYNPATNLPAGVALYWRLRLNGPNGPSLWSDSPRTFIIQ